MTLTKAQKIALTVALIAAMSSFTLLGFTPDGNWKVAKNDMFTLYVETGTDHCTHCDKEFKLEFNGRYVSKSIRDALNITTTSTSTLQIPADLTEDMWGITFYDESGKDITNQLDNVKIQAWKNVKWRVYDTETTCVNETEIITEYTEGKLNTTVKVNKTIITPICTTTKLKTYHYENEWRWVDFPDGKDLYMGKGDYPYQNDAKAYSGTYLLAPVHFRVVADVPIGMKVSGEVKFKLFDQEIIIDPTWWDSDWGNMQTVTITNDDSIDHIDETVKILLEHSGTSNYDLGCNDIRVIDSSDNELERTVQNTSLTYDLIELICNSTHAEIMFNTTTASSSTSNYYIYYNNPDAEEPSYLKHPLIWREDFEEYTDITDDEFTSTWGYSSIYSKTTYTAVTNYTYMETDPDNSPIIGGYVTSSGAGGDFARFNSYYNLDQTNFTFDVGQTVNATFDTNFSSRGYIGAGGGVFNKQIYSFDIISNETNTYSFQIFCDSHSTDWTRIVKTSGRSTVLPTWTVLNYSTISCPAFGTSWTTGWDAEKWKITLEVYNSTTINAYIDDTLNLTYYVDTEEINEGSFGYSMWGQVSCGAGCTRAATANSSLGIDDFNVTVANLYSLPSTYEYSENTLEFTNPIVTDDMIYYPGSILNFNITVSSDNYFPDVANFTFNGIIYTADNRTIDSNSQEYYYTITDFPGGTYDYNWTVNDTGSYTLTSMDYQYVLSQNDTFNIVTMVNDSEDDTTVDNGIDTYIDISAQLVEGGLLKEYDVYLSLNDTFGYGYGDDFATDSDGMVENVSHVLSVNPGLYNITGSFKGNENYTEEYDTLWLTVEQAPYQCQYNNGTGVNLTDGQIILPTYTLTCRDDSAFVTGDIIVNGTLILSNFDIDFNLTDGDGTYGIYNTGTLNITNQSNISTNNYCDWYGCSRYMRFGIISYPGATFEMWDSYLSNHGWQDNTGRRGLETWGVDNVKLINNTMEMDYMPFAFYSGLNINVSFNTFLNIGGSGADFEDVNNSWIHDNFINRSLTCQFDCYGCNYVEYYNNHIEEGTNSMIFVSGKMYYVSTGIKGSNYMKIHNNTGINNGYGDDILEGVNNSIWYNNTISGSLDTLIQATGPVGTVQTNITIENNTLHTASDSPIQFTRMENSIVRWNTIYNIGDAGVLLIKSSGINVTDNHIYDSLSTAIGADDTGVYVDYQSWNNTVENNTIHDIRYAGVYDGAENTTVRYNNIYNLTGEEDVYSEVGLDNAGILLDGTNVSAYNNIITNASTGIYYMGSDSKTYNNTIISSTNYGLFSLDAGSNSTQDIVEDSAIYDIFVNMSVGWSGGDIITYDEDFEYWYDGDIDSASGSTDGNNFSLTIIADGMTTNAYYYPDAISGDFEITSDIELTFTDAYDLYPGIIISSSESEIATGFEYCLMSITIENAGQDHYYTAWDGNVFWEQTATTDESGKLKIKKETDGTDVNITWYYWESGDWTLALENVYDTTDPDYSFLADDLYVGGWNANFGPFEKTIEANFTNFTINSGVTPFTYTTPPVFYNTKVKDATLTSYGQYFGLLGTTTPPANTTGLFNISAYSFSSYMTNNSYSWVEVNQTYDDTMVVSSEDRVNFYKYLGYWSYLGGATINEAENYGSRNFTTDQSIVSLFDMGPASFITEFSSDNTSSIRINATSKTGYFPPYNQTDSYGILNITSETADMSIDVALNQSLPTCVGWYICNTTDWNTTTHTMNYTGASAINLTTTPQEILHFDDIGEYKYLWVIANYTSCTPGSSYGVKLIFTVG